MVEHNEGIIVTGGSFNAGQVSVGRNSQAVQITYAIADELKQAGKDEMAAALTGFMQALEQHAAKIREIEEIAGAVKQIAEESKKEKPSKLTIKGLLEGLKGVVTPVAELAKPFLTLYGAAATMLGLPKLPS